MNLGSVLQDIAQFLGLDDELGTVEATRELLDVFAAMLNEDLPEVGEFHAAGPGSGARRLPTES